MKRKLVRIYFLLLLAAYPFVVAYALRGRAADDIAFQIVLSAFIFLFYFVPLLLLQANVEVTDRGLVIRRWSTTLIDYREISRCFSFFLVPFHVVVIITRRRFPLTIVVAGESNQGGRKSLRALFQDGPLASSIKAMVRAARA